MESERLRSRESSFGAFYTCTQDSTITALAFSIIGDEAVGATPIQNGKTFTLQWSPPARPNDSELYGCPGDSWTRDPNYYSVGVGVEQVAELAFVLFANIGDVFPQ